MHKEKELFMSLHKVSRPPSLQDILISMEASEAYRGIFLHTFKLFYILLSMPIGTATVERSFSEMKMIKTRIRNHLI